MDPGIANDMETIRAMNNDSDVVELRKRLYEKMVAYKYTYNFQWCGRPFIQLPQDMIALQEIIWELKPDLIIETGIAHGGGLIFYASLMEAMHIDGTVLGIDREIRSHNRTAIEEHPLHNKISMIEGSSTDDRVLESVQLEAAGKNRVMVCLDSSHTHEHVLSELEGYSPLVKKGSYIVVFDTVVEDFEGEAFPDRPWGKGNNPKTAVRAFLQSNERFQVDEEIESRLLFTVAPGGYLKCIAD